MSSNYKKGFTLIELVIAIFILSFAVVGVFSIFSMTVILTSDASMRLTGTFLAQEGMEIVQNVRDTNWLKMDAQALAGTVTTTWLDDMSCSSGCEADYRATALSPWGDNFLEINSATGFYVYNENDSTETKFKRKIIVEPITGIDYAAKVTVQVSWDEKPNILYRTAREAGACDSTSNCITVEKIFYDWYNYVPST